MTDCGGRAPSWLPSFHEGLCNACLEASFAELPQVVSDAGGNAEIIVDGKTGFTGGLNVGDEYLGLDPDMGPWRDTHVELRGPVVDVLEEEFERAWAHAGPFGDAGLVLSTLQPGDSNSEDVGYPLRVLHTRPGDAEIFRAQRAAIRNSRKYIYIQNAYFTSDDIIFELAQARRRGVDVRIIIPYQSDSGIITRSNVRAINTMLDNGIRVFIYPGESHIKGAIYDGWICLGSANFDQLSLRMNKELNIATSSPVAVQGFLDMVMLPDFEKSVELKEQLPKKWSDFLMETIADQL